MVRLVDSNGHVTASLTERASYPLEPFADESGKPQDEFPQPSTDELVPLMDQADVSQSVLMSSRNHGFDNTYCVDSAARFPGRFAAGVNINIFEPDVPATIRYWVEERHVDVVRMFGGVMSPASWIDDPKNLAAWQCAAELGVPVTAQTTVPATLPKTRRVLEQVPELALTVTNMANISTSDGARSDAARDLLGLADFPGVYVNFATEFAERALEPNSGSRELLEALVEAFGARRVMWSAFYPSSNLPYEKSAEVLREAVSYLSEEDQAWVLGDSARSRYPVLDS